MDTVEFNPSKNIKDEIITFLVCNRLNFEYKNIVNEMDEIYNDQRYYLRHNMILSIKDGAVMYKGFPKEHQFMFYPYINDKKLVNSILQPFMSQYNVKIEDNSNIQYNKYEHIIGFLNYLYMGTSTTAVMYPEMTNYLGEMRIKNSIIENKIDGIT